MTTATLEKARVQEGRFTNTYIYLDTNEVFDSGKNRKINKNHVKTLMESIKKDGQVHPITVNEHGMIVEGHHRWEACKELGIKVKAFVVEGTTAEDIASFNHMQINWNSNDFLKVRGYDDILRWRKAPYAVNLNSIYEIFGTNTKEVQEGKFDFKADMDTFNSFNDFHANIWTKFKKEIKKKKVKAIGKYLDIHLYNLSQIEGINVERLISQTVNHVEEISSTRKGDVLKNMVSAYNYNMKKKAGRLVMTTEGEVIGFKK